MSDTPETNSGFFNKLRSKIQDWVDNQGGNDHRWADIILLAPDMFYLLWKLSLDKNVPSNTKIILGGVIIYFISPIDLLPEAILGPIGYMDDIALTAFILNKIINDTDPILVRKYWKGEHDILIVIKNILGVADKMLGKGLWYKLKNRFS